MPLSFDERWEAKSKRERKQIQMRSITIQLIDAFRYYYLAVDVIWIMCGSYKYENNYVFLRQHMNELKMRSRALFQLILMLIFASDFSLWNNFSSLFSINLKWAKIRTIFRRWKLVAIISISQTLSHSILFHFECCCLCSKEIEWKLFLLSWDGMKQKKC